MPSIRTAVGRRSRTDLTHPGGRISGVDLVRQPLRMVPWWRVPGGRSAPGFAAPRPASSRTSRRCSAPTGIARFAPPTSSSTTPPLPRTSPRRRFLAAVRNLDRFDRRRPFGPWLHRIVVNRAIDAARARALRAEAALDDALAAPADPLSPDRSVLGALAALPPDQRAVVVLRYVLEYTPGRDRTTPRAASRNGQLAAAPRVGRNEGAPVRKELQQLRVPDADGARDRAWHVVAAAFEGREPAPRERPRWPLVVALAAALLVAAFASPPGRAVLDDLREVVGVERAQPALFSLPSPGRLLVASDAGLWVAAGGRLAQAARRLPRGGVVAVRTLRRRVAPERARRARARRRRPLDAGPTAGGVPALDRDARRIRRSPTSRGAGCTSSPATGRTTSTRAACPLRRGSPPPGARGQRFGSPMRIRGVA